MKLLLKLGALAVIGSSPALATISCKSEEKKPAYKENLGKLINEVEKTLGQQNGKNYNGADALESELKKAKEVYKNPNCTEEECVSAYNSLDEEFKEYKSPGFRNIKTKLIDLIKIAINEIEKDGPIKGADVIDSLEKAINEAINCLNSEATTHEMIIMEKKLWYWLQKYRDWQYQ